MNISTKYEIGQQICFLYSKDKKQIGNIRIFTGTVVGIHSFSINGETKIKYLIGEYVYLDDDELIDDDEYEFSDTDNPFDGVIIDEEFLFDNEKDLMKFFKQNVRIALDKNTPKRSRTVETDSSIYESDDVTYDYDSNLYGNFWRAINAVDTRENRENRANRLIDPTNFSEMVRRYYDNIDDELPK